MTILDKGSNLHTIGVESSTASISHPNLSTSRNAFVTATVTASCCTESVTVNVADASGNQATCTPMKTSTTESNCDPAPCLNGGRCQGPNSCLCLGGYFGNNCGQGKQTLQKSNNEFMVFPIYYRGLSEAERSSKRRTQRRRSSFSRRTIGQLFVH